MISFLAILSSCSLLYLVEVVVATGNERFLFRGTKQGKWRTLETKIVGGQQAPLNSFPYYVQWENRCAGVCTWHFSLIDSFFNQNEFSTGLLPCTSSSDPRRHCTINGTLQLCRECYSTISTLCWRKWSQWERHSIVCHWSLWTSSLQSWWGLCLWLSYP